MHLQCVAVSCMCLTRTVLVFKCLSECDVSILDVCCTDSICVYSPDGSTLLRQWGGERSDADGKVKSPWALAMCAGQLFVLDASGPRVQVFE